MYIGVDLGTSSVKVSLVTAEGQIVASNTQEYPLYSPHPGFSEQRPEDWLDKTLLALKALSELTSLSDVRAMSFSGQMHGLVCLDEADNVIRPAILWNDQRTQKETDYLNQVVGVKKLVEYTANRAVTGFTAPKILWVKNNEPQNFERIAKIMLPKDYLAYMLTGTFATDVSDAGGTLLFDVKNRAWSKQMLEIVGLPESALPKVYESSCVIGTVKEKFCRLTGLNENVKVVIGGGDQAVGAVGTGTVGEGGASISLGTSGVIFVASETFKEDKEGLLHNFCHADGRYHFMGVTLSAAASYGWITDLLGVDVASLESEVAAAPIDDVVFTPYLTGERSPINAPTVKGSFYGLTAQTKRANLARAVMEGVAFSLKDCLSVMNSVGIKPKKARVIGGGSRSKAWVQILADVLDLEICKINTSDGGALGAAILAMVGDGVYACVDDACKAIVKDVESVLPDRERAEKYRKKFEIYKKLQEFSLKLIK
ncbi:MAG: xylulokinase [Clostridia bacterium]|nr:xylulokinase [Clostridia bacterium]